jgi:tRNA threonylcarbamoyladenosine biosynthesis protein TsaE
MLMREFDLPDDAASLAFGQRLARALIAARPEGAATPSPDTAPARRAGWQIHLSGDLGAGKTTLVRATLHALGHVGRVRSPTYTLVEPYTIDATPTHDALAVYHFDLYRFADPAEWADAGFRDYFGSGALCLVEWPEQAGGLLGTPDLSLTLELAGAGRKLIAQAFTETGQQCLARC